MPFQTVPIPPLPLWTWLRVIGSGRGPATRVDNDTIIQSEVLFLALPMNPVTYLCVTIEYCYQRVIPPPEIPPLRPAIPPPPTARPSPPWIPPPPPL